MGNSLPPLPLLWEICGNQDRGSVLVYHNRDPDASMSVQHDRNLIRGDSLSVTRGREHISLTTGELDERRLR